ncbi:DNA-binding transcriptional regulator, MarR family [Gracilibacillus orientalis]|uniref:DNA-binding transcriptional regulator, MarR family n=1 Tax=Gracilibacillus orientalis TaxID=334253 RepID=A0A1I4ISM3_9BACI|nr:MarR family transcriptional regulator [Gracilibacillus orientalis]SFL57304.1 DNA-binding transcriptional regulator, MarR family [Gracilibacillus orientalis]
MKEQDTLTNDLVEQALTVLPILPKKMFGTSPITKKEGLHPSHFHVLHIVEQTGSIQMAGIAKKLDINKSNLTPLIQKLMEKEFIVKTKDEKDRRITYIQMTEKGKQFSDEKKQILHKIVKERFATLADTDKTALKEAFITINLIMSSLDE